MRRFGTQGPVHPVILTIDEFEGIPKEAVRGFLHSLRVATKIWRGNSRYHAGKRQLAAYLKLEGATEGYYVVFDHRQDPEPRVETETIDDVKIQSYVIPVVQERPSETHLPDA